MPYPVLLAKTKLTAHIQNVSQGQQKILILKFEFLDSATSTAQTLVFCIFPSVLLSFEPLSVSTCHDSASMSQAPSWQEMPTSGTLWHIYVVICIDFNKNEWCQLGLGDWLASWYPNQVDSRQVANTSWQASRSLSMFAGPCLAIPWTTPWFCLNLQYMSSILPN